MSGTPKVQIAPVSERDNARYLYRVASIAAYITLMLGYVLSILQASSLNVTNFVGFTVLHIVYAALLLLLVRSGTALRPISQQRAIFYLVGLAILTIGSGLFGASGLNFDWLLYLVTVPENIAKYCIATFRAISCLFREGNPHRMHCKILYTL